MTIKSKTLRVKVRYGINAIRNTEEIITLEKSSMLVRKESGINKIPKGKRRLKIISTISLT
jgi:hypothetical protein